MSYQPTKRLAEMGARFRWETSVDLTRLAVMFGLYPRLPRRPVRPATGFRPGGAKARVRAVAVGRVATSTPQ
jgi:hypothetical protein